MEGAEVQGNRVAFALNEGNESLLFQRFARPFKYFRTVSSTLVTPSSVTSAHFTLPILYVVVAPRENTSCRYMLQLQFS